MGHSHLGCGEDRHLACRFRALVGGQDARWPHSQDGCAPEVSFSTELDNLQIPSSNSERLREQASKEIPNIRLHSSRTVGVGYWCLRIH